MARVVENAGWYRSMARDCLRAAQVARTVELRITLIDQATTWARLAEQPSGYDEVRTGASAPGDRRHVEVTSGRAGDRLRRHA